MSRSRIVWMLFFALLLGAGAAVFFFWQGLETYQANFAQPSLQQQVRSARQAVKLFGLQQISMASSHLKNPQLGAVFAAQGDERKKLATAFLGSLGSDAEGKVSVAFSALSDEKAALIAASKAAPAAALSGVEEAAKGASSQGFLMASGKVYLLVHVPVVGVPSAAAPKKEVGTADKKEEDKEEDKKEEEPAPKKKKCSKGRTWACLKICVKRKGRKCIERKEKCDCYRMRKKSSSLLPSSNKRRLAQAADDKDATPTPAAAPVAPAQPKLLGIFSQAFLLDARLAYQLKSTVFGATTEIAFFLPQGKLLGGSSSKQDADLGKLLGSTEGKQLLEMNKQSSVVHLGTDAYNAVSVKLGSGKLGLLVMQSRGTWDAFLQQNIMWMGLVAGGFVLLLLLLLLPGAGKTEKQLFDLEEQLLDLYRTGNLQVAFNEGAPGAVGSLSATLNRVFFQLRSQVIELQEASIGDIPRGSEATLSLSSPEVQMALNDPESHFRQVFQRYAKAKEKTGEDISQLDQERFLDKLRQNSATFQKQYDCLGVAFDVTIKDNKVILKPQLIPRD